MRSLYPSAHHDRFVHSLGVYHLGTLAFRNIKINSTKYLNDILKDEEWDLIQSSFEIACLMHDCGHSPFSHTFEHYYVLNRGEEIDDRLRVNFQEDEDFSRDYKRSSPAAHEKISCLVLLEKYRESILKCGGNPFLVGRMIMGCTYRNNPSILCKVHNKFINLLNGTALDVDSLDYIQRDSWASGVNNVSIDYDRLLGSLVIKLDKVGDPIVGFKKHAISVLENISLGRNFLYKWIYSHHKVLYDQYLLTNSVDLIDKETNNEFCRELFSIDNFYEPKSYNGTHLFLPTDDDVFYCLKKFHKDGSVIDEYLSRSYKYKALWKTQIEFDNIFEGLSSEDLMEIETQLNLKELDSFLGENSNICISAKPKLKGFKQNHYFIFIDGSTIDASKLVNVKDEQNRFFYLYVSQDCLGRKKEIIQKILSFKN
ncbi:HD domain-containing protein [Labilibaculum sp. A4]|nr:HD domain-containing protein [Labilibaculum euxinus]MWN78015.1 HD domain-containing protein [Labilibaculum euxinus]